MTDQSVPHTVFNLASDLETEASNLRACIELMDKALQFAYKEPEEVERAQAQMFFLTSSMSALHERLGVITAAAYEIAQA